MQATNKKKQETFTKSLNTHIHTHIYTHTYADVLSHIKTKVHFIVVKTQTDTIKGYTIQHNTTPKAMMMMAYKKEKKGYKCLQLLFYFDLHTKYI